jgi:membrane-associated protein
MEILESLEYLTDPNWIMARGGLYLILLILFIETGLFFGFFLPGDPLLFISGMIIASAEPSAHLFDNGIFNLIFWEILFIGSAILGNLVGYWTGAKFGYLINNRKKDYWLLKRKHVESAHQFYQKKGGFAIVISRFLPVARTFVPIIGGMVKMDFKKFTFFSALGAVAWVGSLVTLGYALGENKWVKNNLEWTLLGIVLVVTLPVVFKFIFAKKEKVTE